MPYICLIMIKTYSFQQLFNQYINQGKNHRRRKSNGGVISKQTLENYKNLQLLLMAYEAKTEAQITVYDIRRANKRELQKVKKYWKNFYLQFSNFLYKDKKCYDNYVGSCFKMLRAFFKWLQLEKQIFCGDNYKRFYIPKEQIPIIVLSPERLNYLIHDKRFEQSLSRTMRTTKDMFVFGCTVGLRFSDLSQLTKRNLEHIEGKYYIRTISQKTQTPTRILLPHYAVDILQRNKSRSKFLLPFPTNARFNLNVKELGKLAGWDEHQAKFRTRNGKLVEVMKHNGRPYKFYDHLASHTMRRTAISTLLRLGLDEHLVRKISGHQAGSKEFYKYVEFNQSFMDEKLEKIHQSFG